MLRKVKRDREKKPSLSLGVTLIEKLGEKKSGGKKKGMGEGRRHIPRGRIRMEFPCEKLPLEGKKTTKKNGTEIKRKAEPGQA